MAVTYDDAEVTSGTDVLLLHPVTPGCSGKRQSGPACRHMMSERVCPPGEFSSRFHARTESAVGRRAARKN